MENPFRNLAEAFRYWTKRPKKKHIEPRAVSQTPILVKTYSDHGYKASFAKLQDEIRAQEELEILDFIARLPIHQRDEFAKQQPGPSTVAASESSG